MDALRTRFCEHSCARWPGNAIFCRIQPAGRLEIALWLARRTHFCGLEEAARTCFCGPLHVYATYTSLNLFLRRTCFCECRIRRPVYVGVPVSAWKTPDRVRQAYLFLRDSLASRVSGEILFLLYISFVSKASTHVIYLGDCVWALRSVPKSARHSSSAASRPLAAGPVFVPCVPTSADKNALAPPPFGVPVSAP